MWKRIIVTIFVVFLSVQAVLSAKSISLAGGEQDFTAYGADTFNFFGSSVASGDLNGDGFSDLIIGAFATECGDVYIFFGKRNFGGAVDLSVESPDLQIKGAHPGYNAGRAVGSGDVNGDGYDDIIISSPSGGGPYGRRRDTGEVAIIFGRPNLPSYIDLVNGEQDVLIYGDPQEGLASGIYSDDLNDDGIDDLVLTALSGLSPQHTRAASGRTYVFFGKIDWPTVIDLSTDKADITVYGEDENYMLGSCATVLDFNLDGLPDLFIGSKTAFHPDPSLRRVPGKGYLLLGRQSWPQEIDLALEHADTEIIGEDSWDYFGGSCCSGDINGDGRKELLVSAFRADGPANSRVDSGEIEVFLPSSSFPPRVDLSTSAPDLTVYGMSSDDETGVDLTSSDLNGDGVDDIITGAMKSNYFTGKIYAIFGASTLSGSIDLASTEPDITIQGADTGDSLGFGIATADFNRDGGTDLLFGAHNADGPLNDRFFAGEAYVVLGDAGQLSCTSFDDLRFKIDEYVFHWGLKHSMEVKVSQAEEKFNSGQFRTSGNVLCALVHEARAHGGKEIPVDSADEIILCVHEVADALGIPIECLEDEDSDEYGDGIDEDEDSDEQNRQSDALILQLRKIDSETVEINWTPENHPVTVVVTSSRRYGVEEPRHADRSPYRYRARIDEGEIYFDAW
jgi:hypothetical protein